MGKRKNKKNKNKQNQNTQNEVQSVPQAYTGPLPVPEQLEKYEELSKGAADKIIRMAEQQAAHRQDLEKVALKSNNFRANLGLVLGSAVAFLALIVSGESIVAGYPVSGLMLAFLVVSTLFLTLLYTVRQKRKEMKRKQ